MITRRGFFASLAGIVSLGYYKPAPASSSLARLATLYYRKVPFDSLRKNFRFSQATKSGKKVQFYRYTKLGGGE